MSEELKRADRLMQEFYLSSDYKPDAIPADKVKAAIAFALRTEAKDALGWQPIDTAPKDGEVVLLYKPNERCVGEYTITGYWGEWPSKGECWIASDGKPQGYFSEVANAPQGYPTHWRPLPPTPDQFTSPSAAMSHNTPAAEDAGVTGRGQ